MAKYSSTSYPSGGGVRCPKCGSYGCQPITETEYKSGGYGVFSGLCGYVIMGPVGLLCGLCGRKPKYKTRTYWVCSNCGRRFRS